MDIHVRTLSTVNILFGVLSLLLSVPIFVIYGGPISLYSSMDDNVGGVLLASSVMFHLALAVPCIIAGVHLRSYAEWARSALIVTSALNVLNIPIGSVLGAYGLWVLLTEETDPLFSSPPPNPDAKKSSAVAPTPSAKHEPNTSAATTIVSSPRS
ncbi:MAG TPA: hypothetical protein VEX68_03025 [Bryobacteraceae bacterium]|nr:hypothetical protein [Bryobacteraceae bacterium]